MSARLTHQILFIGVSVDTGKKRRVFFIQVTELGWGNLVKKENATGSVMQLSVKKRCSYSGKHVATDMT